MNIRTELFRDRLPNVAPYCTVTTSGWTGSTTGEVITTVSTTTTSPITGKIKLPPVNPLDSFTLHYVLGGITHSVTADADGNLLDGNLTGTIAQDGTYNLNFAILPDVGTDIICDYSYGIAPANLENALDPSNPNPSDWGWKTTTGAQVAGYITVQFPEKGAYVCVGEWGGYTTGATKISLNVQIDINPNQDVAIWSYIDSWGSLAYSVERIRSRGTIIFGDVIRIYPLLAAADEIYWRLYNLQIFKLL